MEPQPELVLKLFLNFGQFECYTIEWIFCKLRYYKIMELSILKVETMNFYYLCTSNNDIKFIFVLVQSAVSSFKNYIY